jgi:hypothetical protein
MSSETTDHGFVVVPPPNLKPDFEDQARSFVDGVVDKVLHQPVAARAESPAMADRQRPT